MKALSNRTNNSDKNKSYRSQRNSIDSSNKSLKDMKTTKTERSLKNSKKSSNFKDLHKSLSYFSTRNRKIKKKKIVPKNVTFKVSSKDTVIPLNMSYSPNVNNYKKAFNISMFNKERNSLKKKKFQETNIIPHRNYLNLRMIQEELKQKIFDITMSIEKEHHEIKSFYLTNNNNFDIMKKHSTQNSSKKSNTIKEKTRYLFKKNILYDSLEDCEIEEEEDETNGKSLIPESKIVLINDILILISTIYCFVYLPLILTKSDCIYNLNKNYFNKYIIIFIEILFIADMCLSFFRAFYDYEMKLIKNNKKIVINYLKTSFTLDFIEAIPLYSIIICLCINKKYLNHYNTKYNNDNNIITLEIFLNFKLLKIFKITFYQKNFSLSKILDKISFNYETEQLIIFSIEIVLVFFILHFIICLQIFLSEITYPNWLLLTNSQNEKLLNKYITSFYYLIETMTTVGYGDIFCQSFSERVFQIIILAVGIVAYSYLVTYFGNIIKNDSHARIKLNNDINMLEEIRMQYKQMPFKLYNKIYKHLESRSMNQKKCDMNFLINSLPYSMKNKMLYTIYAKEIQNFVFFKKIQNSDFAFKVITNFIPISVKKNIVIVNEGENMKNIIFVKDGKLSLEAYIDTDEPEAYMAKYFDDFSFDFENFDFFNILKENKIIDKQNFGINLLINEKQNQSAMMKSVMTNNDTQYSKDIGQINFNDDNIRGKSEGKEDCLNVLDIHKNEHFGLVYTLIKKPCPLSIKVKSKIAELFLFRKKDAIEICKLYPHFIKKIFSKELHNINCIKQKTFKILSRYVQSNVLVSELTKKNKVNKKHITKNNNSSYYVNKEKEGKQLETNLSNNSKSFSTQKNNNTNNNNKNSDNNFSLAPQMKNTEIIQKNNSNFDINSSSKLNLHNEDEDKKENVNNKVNKDDNKNISTDDNKENEKNESIFTMNNSKFVKDSINQNTKCSIKTVKKIHTKKSKKRSTFFTKSVFINSGEIAKNLSDNNVKKKSPKDKKLLRKSVENDNSNNQFFSVVPKVSKNIGKKTSFLKKMEIKEGRSLEVIRNYLLKKGDFSPKNNKRKKKISFEKNIFTSTILSGKFFSNFDLSTENTTSFQIRSTYNNINSITHGKYNHNRRFQEETKMFLEKYVIENEILSKERISNVDYDKLSLESSKNSIVAQYGGSSPLNSTTKKKKTKQSKNKRNKSVENNYEDNSPNNNLMKTNSYIIREIENDEDIKNLSIIEKKKDDIDDNNEENIKKQINTKNNIKSSQGKKRNNKSVQIKNKIINNDNVFNNNDDNESNTKNKISNITYDNNKNKKNSINEETSNNSSSSKSPGNNVSSLPNFKSNCFINYNGVENEWKIKNKEYDDFSRKSSSSL